MHTALYSYSAPAIMNAILFTVVLTVWLITTHSWRTQIQASANTII